MAEKLKKLPPVKTVPSDAPIRLVFHIGAGKTGTSSIQKTLRTQQQELKQRGFWYMGWMFEHAPNRIFPWQIGSGSELFHALNPEETEKQLLTVLLPTIKAARNDGIHTLIWSNESFFERNQKVRNALQKAQSDGVDLQIIAYVRRHDAWIRSAYIQWGLKHKIYKGPLRPFSEWIRQNSAIFSKSIQSWIEQFPGRCVVRNFDAVGNVVEDFLDVVGIDGEGLEKLYMNETPSAEELVLRSLFNEQFKGKVPVFKFNEMLTGEDIRFDRPIDRILDTLLPTEDNLRQIAADCAKDRDAINGILVESGQLPIVETPLTLRPMSVDVAKVTTAIFQVIVHQAKKIQQLEMRMEQMTTAVGTSDVGDLSTAQIAQGEEERDWTDEAPVFAISTGRSGSTLAQRVLNCHPDLVLWGEHHGFLNSLANAHGLMRNAGRVKFPQTAQDNKGPRLLLPTLSDPAAALEWANPCSLKEFESKLRIFLHDYFGSRLKEGQRWGFKEIRYNNMPTLNMLRILYPHGKFVFIQRDPIEVTRSKVFAFIKENNWQELNDASRRKRVEAMLKEAREHYRIHGMFMKQHPNAGFIVEYEKLVASPREMIAAMLNHLALDPSRYDWALAEQVMGSVITRTKRDETLVGLIREVNAAMQSEQS